MPGFGSIGAPELIIVLIVVMLVFGVGKLPEVGAGLGRGIREFKQNVTGKNNDEVAPPEQRELKG